jgi:hypothetical protein
MISLLNVLVVGGMQQNQTEASNQNMNLPITQSARLPVQQRGNNSKSLHLTFSNMVLAIYEAVWEAANYTECINKFIQRVCQQT